jgi:DNA-binding NarL/FixJ family response regulator
MIARILFYDDNESLRQSLGELLNVEADMEFIGGFANAETVEEDIRALNPDVILMDIDMPAIDGVEAVRRIRKVKPDLPIIMLTVFDDNENIFNAICAGASGYILKQYALSEISGAIRNVLTGGAPMTGLVAKKVLQMIPSAKDETKNNVGLTKKESAILDLMAQGFSYKMIAAKLNNSHDTIRHHIKHIYDKLHVHSATQAVSKAIKDKLV